MIWMFNLLRGPQAELFLGPAPAPLYLRQDSVMSVCLVVIVPQAA